MNIQITADVVMVFGVLILVGEKGWRLLLSLKNGKNGNGNGKVGYVTYKDLMDHSTSCSGGIHNKINEYHNDIKNGMTKLGERLSSLEAKV